MSQFIDSLKAVSDNYRKYDGWEQEQADERAKKEYLAKNFPSPQDKVDLTHKRSQAVIRATEIMDKYSEDNCEDMEQATGMAALIPLTILPLIQNPIIFKVQDMALNKVQKKIDGLKQKLSDEAMDSIENAAKKLELQNKIKILEKKMDSIPLKYPLYGVGVSALVMLGIASSFIMWGNSKQKEASRIGRYQARQKDLKDIKNFVIYTPEQIKQAEEIAKKIPDEKEKNSIIKMINELKAIHHDKKAYKQWIKSKDPDSIDKLKKLNLSPEQLAVANEDKELIVDAVKEINIKAEEYSENVENAFDTIDVLSFLIAAPLGFLTNSILKAFKVASGKTRTLVSILVPMFTTLGISLYGTKAQKDASRVGRYMARKDLTSNPGRLMSYSDEDMKKADKIKAPTQKKTVMDKISKSFSFLVQYYKDKKEYGEYKKTERAKQEKLQKAFSKIQITDEQKAQAEKLQKKVFLAFDEIDEMSQRYSEDVEAGTEIAKTTMSQFWGLLCGGFVAGLPLLFFKGKLPLAKIANTITNVGFSKDSQLRKAINGIYGELKKDKSFMKKFHLALKDGNLQYLLMSEKGKLLAPHIAELLKIFPKEALTNPTTLNQETIKNILTPQLKQGKAAKWARNLISQTIELYMRVKMDMPIGEMSNYKTLIKTAVAGGVPILAVMFSVPYMFNAWLTDIQKKAGKIGIMKAMEKIDDPRVFAD